MESGSQNHCRNGTGSGMTELSFDIFKLSGRLALVTGASTGLGRHFALLLARAGARVAVAARSVDRLAEVVLEIAAAGGSSKALSLDVTDPDAVKSCFDELALCGSPNILVNNAGVVVTRPLLEQTEADCDLVIDTNLKGNSLLATEVARRMAATGNGGSIVNIASILGERVAAGVAPYSISKAGVVHGTKAMALELARHGIRVNALLPGYIATELNRTFLESETGGKLRSCIPTRQFGSHKDLDGPQLLLVSNSGAAMTGATVEVDGGHLVSSL